MRVVLDTNVIVAAYAARGLCSDIFETCLQNHTIVIGDGLVSEIRKALSHKIKLPEEVIVRILELLTSSSERVIPANIGADACRDRSDLHIIGTAVAGRVDYIVTGDPDLLVLKKHEWIPILSPREFWERLTQN